MAKPNWTRLASKRFLLRLTTAVILLVWIGQSVPPLIALAADESCQLSCCQGLTHHAAGSCAGGVCHLQIKKKLPSELICGASELAKQTIEKNKRSGLFTVKRSPDVPIFDETKPDSHNAGHLSYLQASFLEQPCQNVCSVCGSHNFNQQNKRLDEAAAIFTFADKPRPPTSLKIEYLAPVTGRFSQIITRRTPARAPPFL